MSWRERLVISPMAVTATEPSSGGAASWASVARTLHSRNHRHERQDKAAHSKPANGKPGQGRSTEGRSAEGRPGRARPEFSKPGNASGEKRSWGEFRGDSRSEPRTDRPRTEHGASAGINKSPKKPHRKGQNGYAGQRADGPRADSQPVAASRPNFNKPNRPGQRRRKKMQAEREGMAAAV